MELFYNKTGQGRPLIILHGLYGTGDNWMNIARQFSDQYTVYLIDQRNHGRSPHSTNHSYDDMAGDLKTFCDKKGISEFFLIGHSMGGKTASTFTLKYPGMVSRLINVDISVFSYLNQEEFSGQIEFHKLILDTFRDSPIDKISSRNEMEEFFALRIKEQSIRKFLLKNLKRDPLKKFFWQLNTDSIRSNLDKIVDAIPPVKFGTRSFIPVLFIKGGQSSYLSSSDISAIPDIFPNARFTTFENSGHWLHAEEPDGFVTTVRQFLAGD